MSVPRKGLKTITVSGITGALYSATPPFKGSSVDSDKIGAFGDPYYTTVPRTTKSYGEFRFTILDEGNSASLEALSGTVATITVTGTYSSGAADSATASVSCPMAILSVLPGGEVVVDGDHKSTIVITAVPHC